jgi:predicted transcriptional regulator
MPGKFLQKNSSRYLTAYNQIDKFLNEQLQGKLQSYNFYEKVSKWNELGYLSRRQHFDLLQFGKLRNAIVHDYQNEQVIAEPTSKVVKRIEQLNVDVCRPKRLHELFEKKVVTANIDDSIGDILSLFWKYKISQIPIVDGNKIVNVLNTNTIGWWSAATNPGNIPATQISEVLSYSERQNNFKILSQNAKLPEAVMRFRESYSKVNKGWFMDAILITKEGKDEMPIKGIIVLEDLVDYLI